MNFTKEIYEEGIIKLKEDHGAFCVLLQGADIASIAAFNVPEDQRRQGIGSALLEAAEREASLAGKFGLVCDFRSDLEDYKAFMEKSGYGLKETESFISFSAEELLGSDGVEKLLDMNFSSLTAERFSNMMSFQLDEVRNFLAKFKIDIGKKRLEAGEQSLSIMVYNENYNPCAVILASMDEDEIIVDLLMGFSKTNPQYVLAAFQEFVRSLDEQELSDSHPVIKVLTLNKNILPFIKRFLNEGTELTEEFTVCHAEKDLSPAKGHALESTEASDESWRFDIEDIPYQSNITETHWWFYSKS